MQNNDFYQDILEAMADGVYFVDTERRITYWNKAAERITGYASQEVMGHSCAENILRHVDDEGTQLCLEGCPLQATMKNGVAREASVFLHHKFGHRVPVFVRSSPIRDDQGAIVGAVEVFTDNSQHLNILEEVEALRKEVLTDALTRVGNRRYAEITMQTLDEAMEKSNVPFGVLFVDVDHFKSVNDTWGHAAGDKVLAMVAKTLQACMRPLDVACRWGGEEFVLLIPNASFDGMAKLAERLRMLVQNSWLDHEEHRIEVTASFGGAVSRTGEAAESVLERADAKMYHSKNAGRNCVHLDSGDV